MMANHDEIEIRGLRLRCIIGFNPDERREKQDVVIDLTLFTDIRKGGDTDDPGDILNYKTVNKAVIKLVEASSYNTVEALATAIARLAVTQYGVARIRVRVHKPGALRFSDSVGVLIEREAGDFKAG